MKRSLMFAIMTALALLAVAQRPQPTTTCVKGTAYFDGTDIMGVGGPNLHFPGSQSGVIAGNVPEFSIEAWIKADADNPPASMQTIVGNFTMSDAINGGRGFLFGLNPNGKLMILIANQSHVSTSIDLRDGICHHVAVTRHGTSGTIRLYVDGVQISTFSDMGSIAPRTIAGIATPLFVGARLNGHQTSGGAASPTLSNIGNGFKGNIDEVRIWENQELSVAEIQDYMRNLSSQNLPVFANLSVYYAFDQTVGVALPSMIGPSNTDFSGKGNDGIYFGIKCPPMFNLCDDLYPGFDPNSCFIDPVCCTVEALISLPTNTICANSSILLEGFDASDPLRDPPNVNYSWLVNGTDSYVGKTLSLSFPNAGLYEICLTTTKNSCLDDTCITIEVKREDNPYFDYPFSNYCQSRANAFPDNIKTPGGQFTSTTGLIIDNNTGEIDVKNSTPGTYSVTYTTNGFCPSTRSVNVTIEADLDPAFSYGTNTFCVNSSTNPTLVSLASPGGTFNASSGLNIDAATGEIDLSTAGIGSYLVTYSTNGICGNYSYQFITILGGDDATFSYENATYCQNGMDPMPTVATIGGAFSSTSGLMIDAVTGQIDVSASLAGTYTVTYNTKGYCEGTSTQTITIDAERVPVIFITGSDIMCGKYEELCATFEGNVEPGATIIWTDENNVEIPSTNNCIYIFTPGAYTITYTSPGGCTSTATHIVGSNNGALEQLQKVVASDRVSSDEFGYAVSISGDYAVVGARNHNGTGAAYVFQKVGADWIQTHILASSDLAIGDAFGWSVDIKGDKIIVGAPGHKDPSPDYWYNTAKGAAYVFEGYGVWNQIYKVKDGDYPGAGYGSFGAAVAIDGDNCVVGNFLDEYRFLATNEFGMTVLERVMEAGSVSFFNNGGNLLSKTYSPYLSTLNISNSVSVRGWFGFSVDIDGNYVVVGADGENDNSGNGYIYENASLVQTIAGTYHSALGISASISGNTAIIGAPGEYGVGAVRIIDRDISGNWTGTQRIQATDQSLFSSFGWSVGISGDRIIVGARGDDRNLLGSPTGLRTGSAYIFAKNGVWVQNQKILASDRALGDEFGWSSAISGSEIVVGAWHEDEDENGNNTMTFAGSAYFFGSRCGAIPAANMVANNNITTEGESVDANTSGSDASIKQEVSNNRPELNSNSMDEAANSVVVKVYPNPSTSGIFRIETKDLSSQASMEVINMLGETVMVVKNAANNPQINISEHHKGVYFLRIIEGQQVTMKKMIYQ